MRRVQGMVAAAVLAVGACSGDDAGAPTADLVATTTGATLPLAEVVSTVPPPDTGPAEDLAPSQVSAETVPPPEIPGPCDAADLEFWTAQVIPAADTADAVIRVRNAGDEWCEPDISASPAIDPDIEPDVWLDPGATADLLVGQQPGECADPSAVRVMPIAIGGDPVAVPTAMISCAWWLTAFYPNDIAVEPCDPADLDVAVVARSVLVRNGSFVPCRLGSLAAVDGPPSVTVDADTLAVTELAGGDVVAIERIVDVEPVCDDAAVPGALVFESAGSVAASLPGCTPLALGAPAPWFGTPAGPLADRTTGPLDLGAALAALDPFAGPDTS